MFVEKYAKAVNSSDLRDDEHHHVTDALQAAALADLGSGQILGSILARVKYADGSVHKTFEAGTGNLAALLRIWIATVTARGQARKWVPDPKTDWDMRASFTLYDRVATMSLAHWLDGRCQPCNGAGVMETRRTCTCCAGTGRAQIDAGRFESDLIRDMVSELEGIFQAHSGRAAGLLRRER